MLDRSRHCEFSIAYDRQLLLALAGVLVDRLGHDVADRPAGRTGDKIACFCPDARRAGELELSERLEFKNMQLLFGEILPEIVSHQPACNDVFSRLLIRSNETEPEYRFGHAYRAVR
jgi:hypothetical protein